MSSTRRPWAQQRLGVAIVMTALGVTLAVSGCAAAPDEPSERAGTLTIAAASPPNSLDPSRGSGFGAPFQLPVYSTLFRSMGVGEEPAPSLAESYEWVGDGSQTLEVKLREGVVFSDGETPLDAEAVKASLDYFSQGNGGFANLTMPIESIDTPDDHTLVFHLSQSEPTFVNDLAEGPGMGSIINPTVIADDPESLGTTPAGAGPYVLTTEGTVEGSEYRYVPNEHYFDQDAIQYDEIIIRVIADPSTALAGLQSGQLDVSYGTPDAYERATASGLTAANFPGSVGGVWLLDWTGAVVPAIGDARVRTAINLALDREAIADAATFGLGDPVAQVPPAGSLGYDPSLEDAYPYDPDRARTLIADAGYPDGFSMPVIVAGSFTPGVTIAQAVAAQLAEVGIDMQLTIAATGAEFIQRAREPGAFAAIVSQPGFITTGMPGAMTQLFDPSAPTNVSGTVLTDLLTAAETASALSGDEAQEAWAQANEIVIEQAYTIAITSMPTLVYHTDAVADVGTSITLNPIYVRPADGA